MRGPYEIETLRIRRGLLFPIDGGAAHGSAPAAYVVLLKMDTYWRCVGICVGDSGSFNRYEIE